MAGVNLATGYVELVVSTRGLGRDIKREFGEAEREAKRSGDRSGREYSSGMGGGVKRGMGAVGGALKLGLIGAAAGAGIAAAKVFTDGFKGAADLEQSKGAIGAVFGKDAGEIDEAAKNAARSLGLSRNAYNELASTVGAGLKNKGIQDYAGETQKLLGLGADLAAQFGGSTQEAVEALSSLMRGEADPIERYGVSINETAVNAELAARGQSKLTGAALESAKAQARLDLVMRQTADAQGTFARESDTFAGKQQRAAAQWEDLQAKIGTAFLPALTAAMGFISDKAIPALESFGGWISRVWSGDAEGMPGWVVALSDGIAAVSAAVGSLTSGGGGLGVWFAQAAGSVAPLLSVLQNLVATIGAQLAPIVQSIGALFTTVVMPALAALWESIQANVIPAFTLLVGKVTEVVQVVGSILGPIIATIVTKFQELSPQINAAMTQLGQIVRGAMELISAVIGVALDVIRKAWAMWGDNILALIRANMDMVMGVIRGVMNVIQGIINVVMGVITGDWSRAWGGIKQIVEGIWQAISAVVQAGIAVMNQLVLAGLDLVKQIFSNAAAFLAALWQGLWDGLKAIVSAAVTAILGAIQAWFGQVRQGFDAFVGTVRGLWQGFWDGLLFVGRSIMASISGAIDAGLNGIKGFFQTAVDGIRTIWDGLKEAAAAPVRFVIETVINKGLIAGWNSVAGAVGLGQLKPVPGFDGGGWTGPGSRYQPAGLVHADEFVVSKPSRQRFESNFPGLLDHINSTGSLPGYATGGQVFPVPGYATSRGAHGVDSGVDIAAPMGAPVVATRDATITSIAKLVTSYGWHIKTSLGEVFAHLSAILVNVGDQVKAGQQIGAVGSTGNSTGPHLHYVGSGASAGSGGVAGIIQTIVDYAAQFKDFIAGPLGKLGELGDSPIAQLAGGMARKLGEAMTAKVTSAFAAIRDSITALMSGGTAGAGWQSNANLLMQAGKSLGVDRHAMKIALMTAAQESSMGTNRSAMYRINSDGDVGWFQQRATRGDGTVEQLADPLYGLRTFLYGKNVPAGYHVPGLYDKAWQSMGLGQAAQAVQVSAFPRAYDKWADEAEAWLNAFKYDSGGWLQPGVTLTENRTGKPEAVLTDEQWRLMSQQQSRPQVNQTFITNYPETERESTAVRRAAAAAAHTWVGAV